MISTRAKKKKGQGPVGRLHKIIVAPKARFRNDWLHTVVGFEIVSCNGHVTLFGDFFRDEIKPARTYGEWFCHDMRTFFRDKFSDLAAITDLMVIGGRELGCLHRNRDVTKSKDKAFGGLLALGTKLQTTSAPPRPPRAWT